MDTFENHLEELLQTADTADTNHKIWWLYQHDRPTYVGTMNEYLSFFRASIHAHFVAMLMSLYKLGDNRNDSIGVSTLLAEADQDPEFDRDVLAAAKSRLDELQPIFKKIRILRHKYFAHRDRTLTYDQVLELANISYAEFGELIDRIFDLLGEILAYKQRTTWPRDLADYAVEDTRRLLQALEVSTSA